MSLPFPHGSPFDEALDIPVTFQTSEEASFSGIFP
jgi:hypothetical protein